VPRRAGGEVPAERGGEVPALASCRYGVADVLSDEVGVGVGGSVAGGLVACGVTVCRGVTVCCGDGVTVGTGERCGVRWGAGRFVCDGAGVGELDCCAPPAESLAVPGAGGLTHV
jgi:hypothetical protein